MKKQLLLSDADMVHFLALGLAHSKYAAEAPPEMRSHPDQILTYFEGRISIQMEGQAALPRPIFALVTVEGGT
jgi:hypothetical protein